MDLNARLDVMMDRDEVLASIATSFRTEGAEGPLPLEFAFMQGIDDPSSFDPGRPGEHGGAYERFLGRKVQEALGAALDRIGNGFMVEPDGRIRLWRSIVVAEGWERGEVFERPLGLFWAFDPEYAVAHHGPSVAGMRTVVLEGLVDPDGIDWELTVTLNAVDEATVGEEREVRLLASAKVELVAAQGIDVSHLAGISIAVGLSEEADLDPHYHNELHRAAGAVNGFYGSRGAGCLVVARSTGRLLMPLRSEEVLQPGTYGVWGGAVDPGLTPEEAALRELRQESGLDYAGDLVPLLVYAPEGSSFRYHNFLVVVDEEFEPELNEEHDSAVWASLDDLPGPLHFGVEALLRDEASRARVIEAHASLERQP